MDKSMIKGIVIGGIAVTAVAAGGMTGYKAMKQPAFAEVISAKEVTETIRTPRDKCEDVAVRKQAPVKDEYRIAGTVAGAVAGGLIGSTIGGGTGNKLATAAGAAAGGFAGNQVQKSLQEKDTVAGTEHYCEKVYETSVKHLGYDVTYRLNGKEGVVRMAGNPGARIPVKDGKLVLEAPGKG